MAKGKNDTDQPILFLVRRGRGGRGYLVSPLDDRSNPYPCGDAAQLGEAIIELLDDPKQARFDESQLDGGDEDEDEDEGGGAGGGGGGSSAWDNLSSGEKLLLNVAEGVLGKAREMSNSYRKTGSKKKKSKARS